MFFSSVALLIDLNRSGFSLTIDGVGFVNIGVAGFPNILAVVVVEEEKIPCTWSEDDDTGGAPNKLNGFGSSPVLFFPEAENGGGSPI